MNTILLGPGDDKIHILRQQKFKTTFILCPFGPPLSPLVCVARLHYALARPLQWQKYLLDHKAQFLFF